MVLTKCFHYVKFHVSLINVLQCAKLYRPRKPSVNVHHVRLLSKLTAEHCDCKLGHSHHSWLPPKTYQSKKASVSAVLWCNGCNLCQVPSMITCRQTHSSVKNKVNISSSHPFNPQKVLVLPKVTRFCFEKSRFPDLNESELRRKLAERGSDYEHLVARHTAHMKSLEGLVKDLKDSGLDVKVCEQKADFTEEAVEWADLVVSAGGDGTFLSAAKKVFGDKPIIGINTDFVGSEGFLCLPKQYSSNVAKALELMKTGSFRWKKRARIRVTVKGGDTSHPIDLYDEDFTYSDHVHRHNSERKKLLERRLNGEMCEDLVIPVRALNEVFVGESLSSRMSYYEISVDDGPLEKQKSSGITICTGTGSTSWSFNINKLSYQSVEEILKIANHLTGSNYPTNQESVKTVADMFNGRLLFDPRVLQMVYTVRDPVVSGIFQVLRPRGFARKITIRSRCRDACLTVDAGISYLFNDGATATLEMHDEDAIKTIELIE